MNDLNDEHEPTIDDFCDEADFRYDSLRDDVATGTASPAEEGIWERMNRESAAANAANHEQKNGE